MACEHCTHCREADTSRQEAADLFPLGTHLIHPTHGQVIYWRNDIDSSGQRGRGHYVYRAGDADRELIYVHGDEFQLATLDIDLPESVAAYLAADEWAAPMLAEIATARRPHRGGERLTLTYAKLHDLARVIYWARDMATIGLVRRSATAVGTRIAKILDGNA